MVLFASVPMLCPSAFLSCAGRQSGQRECSQNLLKTIFDVSAGIIRARGTEQTSLLRNLYILPSTKSVISSLQIMRMKEYQGISFFCSRVSASLIPSCVVISLTRRRLPAFSGCVKSTYLYSLPRFTQVHRLALRSPCSHHACSK